MNIIFWKKKEIIIWRTLADIVIIYRTSNMWTAEGDRVPFSKKQKNKKQKLPAINIFHGYLENKAVGLTENYAQIHEEYQPSALHTSDTHSGLHSSWRHIRKAHAKTKL